jgi:voltage-gated potassium channel
VQRRTIYKLLEGDQRTGVSARSLDALLFWLIVASVGASVLETHTPTAERWGGLLRVIEFVAGTVFVVEYLARAWVCVEDPRGRYRGPGGRPRYLLSPLALIDLIAIVPTLVAVFSPLSTDQLWLLRALRVLKLLRYSSAVEVFAVVVSNERHQLRAALTIMLSLLVVLSSLVYLAEHEAQPDKFGSVPDAMWWGIVTLSTVGYGDIVPITPLGRVVGAFSVVLGLGMFALPAGILASGFVEEMRRRNFVVTWNLVASVPFFQNLPAARIAEIAAVLQADHAARGEEIIRRGDSADCMYYIVSGEVEVLVDPSPVRLRAGDFFGEIALLTDLPRTATVVAATSCQLLILRMVDFRKILEAHGDLREVIERVARERLATTAAGRNAAALLAEVAD